MRAARGITLGVAAAILMTLSGCADGETPPEPRTLTPYYGSQSPTPSPTAVPSATPSPAAATSTSAVTADPGSARAFTRAIEQYCVRYFVEQRRAEEAFPAPDLLSQIGFARATARSAQRLRPALDALKPPPDLTYTFAAFAENEQVLREARAGIAASLAATGTEGTAGDAFDEAIAARRPLAVTMRAATCDGKLPSEQRREVTEALRTFETTDDSTAACADLATDGFLQTRWFDLADPLEGCIASRQRNAEGLGLSNDIEVTDVAGSDGIAATVSYSLVGGCECGEDAAARLHYVDGRWLVSALGY